MRLIVETLNQSADSIDGSIITKCRLGEKMLLNQDKTVS